MSAVGWELALTESQIAGIRKARDIGYVLLDGSGAVEEIVAENLPRKLLLKRGATHNLLLSDDLIRLPKAVIDKFQELRSNHPGLFVFYIVTPIYSGVPQRGSWLVGQVNCTRWWSMIAPIDFE
jgi:hypothetical protein